MRLYVCKCESRLESFLTIYCATLLPRYWTGYNMVSFHFHYQQIILLSDYRTSGCRWRILFLYIKQLTVEGEKINKFS